MPRSDVQPLRQILHAAFKRYLTVRPLGFELNVFSVFRLCQLAAPHMQTAGGGADFGLIGGDHWDDGPAQGAERAVRRH